MALPAVLEFEIPVRSWKPADREILLAKLYGIGFEGFTEQEHVLRAYIGKDSYSADHFHHVIDDMAAMGRPVQFTYHETGGQNWNREWEKSFDPVVISGEVLVRAPFHPGDGDLPCTLVIEPKMSFGTGHHYTTKLMIREMIAHEMAEKSVLDMGCGTGILGILASKKGAVRVLGMDNDQWAYENAVENVERNHAVGMEIRLGDATGIGGEDFDMILANITRNILIRDMPVYKDHLTEKGILILSGFLAEDVQYVLNAAYRCRMSHLNTLEGSNWICLSFVKEKILPPS